MSTLEVAVEPHGRGQSGHARAPRGRNSGSAQKEHNPDRDKYRAEEKEYGRDNDKHDGRSNGQGTGYGHECDPPDRAFGHHFLQSLKHALRFLSGLPAHLPCLTAHLLGLALGSPGHLSSLVPSFLGSHDNEIRGYGHERAAEDYLRWPVL